MEWIYHLLVQGKIYVRVDFWKIHLGVKYPALIFNAYLEVAVISIKMKWGIYTIFRYDKVM